MSRIEKRTKIAEGEGYELFEITEQKVNGAKKAVAYFRELIGEDIGKQELFCVMGITLSGKYIYSKIIHKGTSSQCTVHPREVFADAVEKRVESIIVCHNHPSGTLTPSLADTSITKRLVECGELLGIKVLDHIILTEASFMSFQEEEMI